VNQTPNPGSPEAVTAGCTCAVMDNHYGKGFPYGGNGPCFYVSADCPLHGKNKSSEEGVVMEP